MRRAILQSAKSRSFPADQQRKKKRVMVGGSKSPKDLGSVRQRDVVGGSRRQWAAACGSRWQSVVVGCSVWL